MSQAYKVIGLMSGTSLDGVDIAYCFFRFSGNEWSYEIIAAETVPYPGEWKQRISSLQQGSALELAATDAGYGTYLGDLTLDFTRRNKAAPDFIASHGHTVFHQPGKKMTFQIGKGSAIAAVTGLPVVCDFRSGDVSLGGQGAPLVPVGDRYLFPQYDFCLNLGGFGNISYESRGKRIAFDICPVNTVLNHLAGNLGLAYDKEGEAARSGTLDKPLLEALDGLEYYRAAPPKSLGTEWLSEHFFPVMQSFEIPVNDRLRTVCEHVARQVSGVLPDDPGIRMLVTGGGALNSFLVERIRQNTRTTLVLPDMDTIHFKEALIFAFLGILRWREEPNCLSSVTGASQDNIGGAVYYPYKK